MGCTAFLIVYNIAISYILNLLFSFLQYSQFIKKLLQEFLLKSPAEIQESLNQNRCMNVYYSDSHIICDYYSVDTFKAFSEMFKGIHHNYVYNNEKFNYL